MSLPILDFNVDDTKTIKFQLREADKITPVDITDLIFRFFARDEAGDSAYTISPVTAVLTNPTNGQGEFQDVSWPSDPTNSFYWIEREDGVGNVDTFPPSLGTQLFARAK